MAKPKRPPFMEIGPTLCVSPEVAAHICNVTFNTFNQWLREDKNPPPREPVSGMIPVIELGRWIREHQVVKRGRGGGGFPYAPAFDRIVGTRPHDNLEAPDVRLKRLQGDKVEMENMVRAGELLPVSEVDETISKMVTRVRTRLLRLPVAIAPLVIGETDEYAVQQRLQDAVHEALEDLADGDTE